MIAQRRLYAAAAAVDAHKIGMNENWAGQGEYITVFRSVCVCVCMTIAFDYFAVDAPTQDLNMHLSLSFSHSLMPTLHGHIAILLALSGGTRVWPVYGIYIT